MASITVQFDSNGISLNGVLIPYIKNDNVEQSVLTTKESIAKIMLNDTPLSTFYEPSTNMYYKLQKTANSSVYSSLKTLIDALKNESTNQLETLLPTNTAVDKTRFINVVSTTALVTSILTKVYIAMTVHKKESTLPNADKSLSNEEIDQQIETVKELLKNTFSLVMQLDSVNDMLPE